MKYLHSRYRGAILAFMAVLLLFLGLFDLALFSEVERSVLGNARRQAEDELSLLGSFTREALLRHDQATARKFLNQWTSGHPDIIELRVVAPDGAVLVDFRRPMPEANAAGFNRQLQYAGSSPLRLRMRKDFTPVVEGLDRLRLQMGERSVLLAALMGVVLWYILRRLALVPLEREIAARRQTEGKYRELVEGTDNLITQVNARGELTFVNHQSRNIFGLRPEECLGRSAFDFIHAEDRETTRQALQVWIEKKMASATIENRQVSRTGEVRDLLWTTNLHYGRNGEVLTINSIGRDITRRKQAEEKIRRSYQFQSTLNEILRLSLEPLPLERQLAGALDQILAIPSFGVEKRGCVYVVEEDPRTLVMKAQQGFTPEHLAQCARVPFGKCLCGQAALNAEAADAGCQSIIHETGPGASPHGHYCIPIRSGERLYGLINLEVQEPQSRERDEGPFLSAVASTLAGMVERSRTAADRQKLQTRLIEAEKLSALGRMTTNVAHEIRNPLTVVGGLARRLDRRIPDGTTEKKYTRVIAAEARRLEKILKRVDSYVFDLPLEKHALNFNRLVSEALAGFAETCAERSIEVRTSLAELPPVAVDRRKVREVLDNVLDNGIDAMPKGGALTVETRRKRRDERDYAVVRIADTGVGIEPQDLDRILEPFYTTKAAGGHQAVGLGLSITKKFMDRHEGFIEVQSRRGEGSTFELFFPIGGE
ncbi:MAG: ATP-binding protein [Desulfobacteraceae bacterium]|nr:ATP-binding protein [Desulfobacteraceae bacterium]